MPLCTNSSFYGYGIRRPPWWRSGSGVRSQVATINIQRRSLYSKLAASKGVSPSDVGVTAGCQLLARVAVGESYMWADGRWRRRGAGQAVPIPDYCR